MIQFFVEGMPRPSGSKRAFRHPTTGKIIVTDTSGVPGREWRQEIKAAARRAIAAPVGTGPVYLALEFLLPRPKAHFLRHALRPLAPRWHTVRPDVLKCARSIEDALTGIAWADDAQIAQELLLKRYAAGITGVFVTIDLMPLSTLHDVPDVATPHPAEA